MDSDRRVRRIKRSNQDQIPQPAPKCFRVEKGLRCRHKCKPGWIMCHNYDQGYCRKDVIEDKCPNGWHITEKQYEAKRFWIQNYCRDGKRDAKLQMYLSRFGYRPNDSLDRRQLEEAFTKATAPWQTDSFDCEQIAASHYTYEEFSEAFQYILDSIKMWPPMP